MSLASRIVAVSVEVSSTYPAPAATTDSYSANVFSSAIHQFRNTTPVAIDTTVVDLQELRQTFTSTLAAKGRQLYKLTPGLVVMGIGDASGNIPSPTTNPKFRLGKILRMCGMQESTSVTSGNSSLIYTFRSTGFENGFVNVGFNDDTNSCILYKMNGVYGTLTMSGSAGQVIQCDPTLTGLVNAQPTKVPAITAILPPAGNTAETMKSEGLSLTGVTNGTIASANIKFKSFSLDFGIDVQEDSDANSSNALYGLLIANRNPTLQVVVGMDSARAADLYTDLNSTSVTHTIAWTHGSTQGRRMAVSATGQLTNITVGDDSGLRTMTLDYSLVNATAEGELTLTFS